MSSYTPSHTNTPAWTWTCRDKVSCYLLEAKIVVLSNASAHSVPFTALLDFSYFLFMFFLLVCSSKALNLEISHFFLHSEIN